MKDKYYKAYNLRYKTMHELGLTWEYNHSTPLVLETIVKYSINKNADILEIGCGEGRDTKVIADKGYKLLAIDVSNEAIRYCKDIIINKNVSFKELDCLTESLNRKFDFIYSVAVIHMLVLDEDRNKYFNFIYNHLKEDGLALILSMGNGIEERSSDINDAYNLTIREHYTGIREVVNTSCRIVSFNTLEKEIKNNNLIIEEKGIVSNYPSFNQLMYVVLRKNNVSRETLE